MAEPSGSDGAGLGIRSSLSFCDALPTPGLARPLRGTGRVWSPARRKAERRAKSAASASPPSPGLHFPGSGEEDGVIRALLCSSVCRTAMDSAASSERGDPPSLLPPPAASQVYFCIRIGSPAVWGSRPFNLLREGQHLHKQFLLCPSEDRGKRTTLLSKFQRSSFRFIKRKMFPIG